MGDGTTTSGKSGAGPWIWLLVGLFVGAAGTWFFAKSLLPDEPGTFNTTPNAQWLAHKAPGATQTSGQLLKLITGHAGERLKQLDPAKSADLTELQQIIDVLAEVGKCASGHLNDQPEWDTKHGYLVTAEAAAKSYKWKDVKASTGLMHGH